MGELRGLSTRLETAAGSRQGDGRPRKKNKLGNIKVTFCESLPTGIPVIPVKEDNLMEDCLLCHFPCWGRLGIPRGNGESSNQSTPVP